MGRFSGKVALITGSSKGIGRAIAVRFAQEGANVIINSRNNDEHVAETIRQVEETGAKVHFIKSDISKVEVVYAMVKESVEVFGKLDILVNNAGVEINAPFWEVTEKDYDTVMNINLKGMFFLTQAFVRYMMENNVVGVIVNNSSVHEELPFPNFTAYCASKGAMQMVMRNLAVELGPLNIRINNVAPGAIKTPINADLLSKPELLGTLQNNISLRRLGEPEDVAGVVAFLASDDAKYVTGSTYYVDGGLTFHYTEQ
ncbi:SDR family NAD(P)-dependent oxidoreductase [Arcicella rosea]|uniref:Glucose 1-dehydrogenase n=1 Tax=Arcicella rosea TaxID=502909 RepID=A0A841ELR5_9BACT|nr:glucose 1-dehydrogenase [Arcicella rosea]MBB6004125.1 glucose 1-dehydrogenase [Arcicella rosea]